MDNTDGVPVYSVTQLNREVRTLIEHGLPALWVTGEISNLARPASGHLYFTLKDEQAQVRCAMFRNAARTLRHRPENGQQVLLHARAGLYEARGEFQLVAEHMELAGDGLLLRRLEELKRRLAAEGLFDARDKRPLPELPRSIGVITSPSGAAVRDILHILRRRFPAIPVVLYPVQVQGEQAKTEIVTALRRAGERSDCDVLILARGGGSLEDLWSFNEEIVVRAIRACPLPVITGVGHETDFTLADLAADLRAPTPSGAAELVVPDWRQWAERIQVLVRRGERSLHRNLERRTMRTGELERRLQRTHPGFVLGQRLQRLDELTERLQGSMRRSLDLRRHNITHAAGRLRASAPHLTLLRRREQAARLQLRITTAVRSSLAQAGSRLAVAAAALQSVSPLRTLERGYAIVSDASTGKVLRRTRDLAPGQRISGRLADGSFEATVTGTREP